MLPFRVCRPRFECAGDARCRGPIVLQPVEEGSGGAVAGVVEFGARRKFPERFVDPCREAGVALVCAGETVFRIFAGGVRVLTADFRIPAGGLHIPTIGHRIPAGGRVRRVTACGFAGERACQTGDVDHRASGGAVSGGRLQPLHRCGEGFEPRAEGRGERGAEIAEPLPRLGIADDPARRGEKRLQRRRHDSARIAARVAGR